MIYITNFSLECLNFFIYCQQTTLSLLEIFCRLVCSVGRELFMTGQPPLISLSVTFEKLSQTFSATFSLTSSKTRQLPICCPLIAGTVFWTTESSGTSRT